LALRIAFLFVESLGPALTLPSVIVDPIKSVSIILIAFNPFKNSSLPFSLHTLQTATLFLQRNLQLRQQRHESKVREDPTVNNGKAEECSKLGEKFKLAKEKRNACCHTGDHSIEDTNSQVTECFRDSIVGVPIGNFVGMCQVYDVINRKPSNDSNEGTFNTSECPSCNIVGEESRYVCVRSVWWSGTEFLIGKLTQHDHGAHNTDQHRHDANTGE